MNCQRPSIVLFCAVLALEFCSCRATNTKAATPNRSAIPDDWEKSKDCAKQAQEARDAPDGLRARYEKAIQQWAGALSLGQLLGALEKADKHGKVKPSPPITFDKSSTNHYSAQYNRCFVAFTYTMNNLEGDPKIERKSATILMDAFEKSLLAILDFTPNCFVEGEHMDCAATANFIDEHLKH
jgi:hypothetical protein